MPSKNRRNSSPCWTYRAATIDGSSFCSAPHGSVCRPCSAADTGRAPADRSAGALTELDALWRGIIEVGEKQLAGADVSAQVIILQMFAVSELSPCKVLPRAIANRSLTIANLQRPLALLAWLPFNVIVGMASVDILSLEANVLIGPIFARELATAPRRPQHFAFRLVYGGALFLAMCTAFLVFYGTQVSYTIGDMARFASILFFILAPLQLALLTFLSALRAASAVSQEKDRRTILLLLMTRLSNREIVLGKLLASLLDVFVMLATAAPIFMLLTLFGGISTAQVARVFAVTLATVLVAGSLGSTVALAREKTFQSLAMTALLLVSWIGLAEAAAALAGDATIGGVPVASIAAAASPLRAIFTASDAYRDTLGLLAAADTWFILTALAIAAALNAFAIVQLRVGNPGRELLPPAPTEEEDSATVQGPKEFSPEAARAVHVDG